MANSQCTMCGVTSDIIRNRNEMPLCMICLNAFDKGTIKYGSMDIEFVTAIIDKILQGYIPYTADIKQRISDGVFIKAVVQRTSGSTGSLENFVSICRTIVTKIISNASNTKR